MKAKNREVLVHPRWRTVHEISNGRPACGNGQGATGRAEPIAYRQMPLSKVDGSWPPCMTAACVIQRRWWSKQP